MIGATARCLLEDDFSKHPPLEKPFCFGLLELVDAMTDGVAIAVVFTLERNNQLFEERLMVVWGLGPVGCLFEWQLLNVGLAGLMLASQFAAGAMQGGIGMLETGSRHLYLAADAAGLGGLAARLPFRPGLGEIAGRHLARALFQGMPQLLFQSSAILASGGGVLEQPLLVFSMVVTATLHGVKGAELARAELQWMLGHAQSSTDRPEATRWSFFVLFALFLLALGFLLSVPLRLALSEICTESRLFDVSLGAWHCAAAPLPP